MKDKMIVPNPAWQKCPVCNGSGKRTLHNVNEDCPKCEGKRIISIQFGTPPLVK